MTSYKFKRWACGVSSSILIVLLLFSEPLANSQPIMNSSGQNQTNLFYEGFEELTPSDLMSEDFDVEVTGDVPYGITSESAHSDSNSLFVGPSTCGGFCFDNFSVIMTIPSINLASSEYNISYWRRESYDFGGSNTIYINGLEVYNEDADDGVFNTGEDTGWYQRNITYTGSIDSITFRETDLTSRNTIYLDDIIIQGATNIETSTIVTTELDTSSEESNEQTTTQPSDTTVDSSQPSVNLLDPTIPQSGLVFGLMISLLSLIAVVNTKTRNSRSNYP